MACIRERLVYLCLCKALGIGLLLAVLCFAAEEYITFGMWNAGKYVTFTGCNEAVYNFKPSERRQPVIDDDVIRSQCGVYDQHKGRATEIQRYFSNTSLKTPLIMTKCGNQPAKLISYRIHKRNYDASTNKIVPNIVHYTSFGNWTFSFLNYLSFKSVDSFISPNYIFVHGDSLPSGPWWQKAVDEFANIFFVERPRPVRIQGRQIRWIEHSSDVMRLETILNNGGIYLDTDIIVLKSFDELRHHELTLGRETYYGLGSGIIIAAPRAPFVCVWLHVYRDYNPFPWNWAYYAVHFPNKLAKVLPEHIHIEEDTLQQPYWGEAYKLFDTLIDWSESYAVHVWKRFGSVPGVLRISHVLTLH